MFPKDGASMETDTHSRALTYLSGSPVKEPSLQVPLMESLQRDALFLEPSIHHSESPVYRVSQEEWTKLQESVPYVELY